MDIYDIRLAAGSRQDKFEVLVGKILREQNLVPFTGRDISYILPDDIDPEEVIGERKFDFLLSRYPEGLPSIWIVPEGWDNQIIRLIEERGGELMKSPEEWERIPFLPNDGFPGNRWEIVLPSIFIPF